MSELTLPSGVPAGAKLAVIVPVYNEAENVRPFHARLRAALDGIADLGDWRVVFINNGSEDESLSIILELRAADPRVQVLTLSKNFGYHGALLAGLSSVDSELYAMVDVDGEDPPELFPALHAELQKGADLAYGIRSQRDEPAGLTRGRKWFYSVNRRIADSEFVMWMGEFCMMTRQVRDAIIAPNTTYPFIRAEMGYIGFKRAGVPYLRAKRAHGQSHYNLFRMTQFAVAGILASTTFPLRLTLYCAVAAAVGYPLAVLLFRLSAEQAARVASVLSLYFLLVTIPFIALYLARTYKNGVARPVFIIDWRRTHLE